MLQNLIIRNNTVDTSTHTNAYGGGIYCLEADINIYNCQIFDNTAMADGGGIYSKDANPSITNCLLHSNTAMEQGGGMTLYNFGGKISFCTISQNQGNVYGGGIHIRNNSDCTISNSIIYLNTTAGSGADLSVAASNINVAISNTAMSTSIFDPSARINSGGGFPETGLGNFTTDPSFVDTSNDDYRLNHTNSPCINAGSHSIFLFPNLIGTTTTSNGIDIYDVDMGYHFIPF